MYLNNSSSINNNNQNSVLSQQRRKTNETCSSNPGDLNFQQPKAIIGKTKDHCEQANENLKHKYSSTSGMAEKRKKLPPGYVNVSTTNLSDINCDEEAKNGTGHVSYVNTGSIQNASILSRIQSESQSSPDLVGLSTNTFKFGLDPIKPEIPSNDSHPPISSIAPPPLMEKLSPQKNFSEYSEKFFGISYE
jgi:hypothetical protein